MNNNYRIKLFPSFLSALLIGVAFFISACSGGGAGNNSTNYKLPADASTAQRNTYISTQVDSIINTQQNSSQPGLSLIIKKDGRIIYSNSRGMANMLLGTAITSDTSFEIASVTKPITAIAVMQLVEKGSLALNDSILKWLPNLPSSWGGVTIHHLLSHTSGIPDCCSGLTRAQLKALNGVSNQDLTSQFEKNNVRLLFIPGVSAKYSNSNYILLAEIIAQASSVSYAQYLQNNVFTPLGMHSTFVRGSAAPAGTSIALNNGITNEIYGADFKLFGAVGISSSTTDLSVLISALLSGQLVSMDKLRLMASDQSHGSVSPSRPTSSYGYGGYVPMAKSALGEFFHPGGLDGFHSIMYIDYINNLNYIILGNGGLSTTTIAQSIINAIQEAYP